MAEADDIRDFIFDLYIGGAGPHWEKPFHVLAEKAFAQMTPEFSESECGWGLAALMVRSGLLVCERRDPGLYHDFLVAALIPVSKEKDRVIESSDDVGELRKVPWQIFATDNEFLQLGERILDDQVIDEPRAVAYALISEGIKYCQFRSPNTYRGFIVKVGMLLLDESDRVEGGPRRFLPRNASAARETPRLYQALFNRAARPPANV